MKPSCAVMKLTLACGLRPPAAYRSLEPDSRDADLADDTAVAPPVRAHRVAVAAVPFGPTRREAANLVAALAQVPWLGDQLHLSQHRVLAHDVKEAAARIEAIVFTRQRGSQVEAEAVDVQLRRPSSAGCR